LTSVQARRGLTDRGANTSPNRRRRALIKYRNRALILINVVSDDPHIHACQHGTKQRVGIMISMPRPFVDDKIRQEVIAELDWEPSVNAALIGVTVDNGVVTLSGHVENYLQKSAAEEAAMRVRGVTAVAQQIEVRPPKRFSNSDDEIARHAADCIKWDARIPSGWITPIVDKGCVTLKGEVDWQYQRAAAESKVRHLAGVIDVYNHVTLRFRPVAEDLKQRIEAALQRNAAIEARSIRVSVDDHRIIIEGHVHSQAERSALEQAVWAAPGVTSIDDRVRIDEAVPSGNPLCIGSEGEPTLSGLEPVLRAKDVMTQPVLTIAWNASIFEAARLMLEHKISGLLVVDASESLIGIITEGDFLRRTEIGTLRRRSRWIELLIGAGQLAQDYARASGRRVDEIMTANVHSVCEETSLDEVVSLMERHCIKRVPVVRAGMVVGIITRANVMRASMKGAKTQAPVSIADPDIRNRLLAHLHQLRWAPVDSLDISVVGGVVTLSGVLTDERQRQALRVAAENTPGVKAVEDRLSLLLSGTGLVGNPPLVVGPGS
jgi:osmotically-inducible protein OsmY